MDSVTTLGESAAMDIYRQGSSTIRLWDGSLLGDLKTPRHDLAKRARPFPRLRNYFHTEAMRQSVRWLKDTVMLERAEYDRLCPTRTSAASSPGLFLMRQRSRSGP